MPLRQIRKHKNSKSKSKSLNRKTKRQHQRGGDPGRIALPMAYFAKNNTTGYYADGSSALQGCGRQTSVSQGVVSSDGKWAGPNLYPQLGGRVARPQRGGSCGCRRRSKRKTQIRKH